MSMLEAVNRKIRENCGFTSGHHRRKWGANLRFSQYPRKDLTLWNLQVDKYSSPFSKTLNGDIVDSLGNKAELYPEVISCLNLLKEADMSLAIASRIADVAGGYQLLVLFGIIDYFNFVEIYPTGKTLHFRRLSRKTGIGFDEMVFYDDDHRNIKVISKLGVTCSLIENGLSLCALLPLLNLLKNSRNR